MSEASRTILDIPPEVWLHHLPRIDRGHSSNRRDVVNLARTCSALYDAISPILYQCVFLASKPPFGGGNGLLLTQQMESLLQMLEPSRGLGKLVREFSLSVHTSILLRGIRGLCLSKSDEKPENDITMFLERVFKLLPYLMTLRLNNAFSSQIPISACPTVNEVCLINSGISSTNTLFETLRLPDLRSLYIEYSSFDPPKEIPDLPLALGCTKLEIKITHGIKTSIGSPWNATLVRRLLKVCPNVLDLRLHLRVSPVGVPVCVKDRGSLIALLRELPDQVRRLELRVRSMASGDTFESEVRTSVRELPNLKGCLVGLFLGNWSSD